MLHKRRKGEDPKAYRARLAKAVEAGFAYRHLLLAGYTPDDILRLAGISNLGELRREHALELMKMKMLMEAAGKRVIPYKPLKQSEKRKRRGVRNHNRI